VNSIKPYRPKLLALRATTPPAAASDHWSGGQEGGVLEACSVDQSAKLRSTARLAAGSSGPCCALLEAEKLLQAVR
jgi:hypothetical protein